MWGSRGSTRATERDWMARGQRMSSQRRSQGNGCFATDVFATEEARGRRTEGEIAALGSQDGGGLSSSYAKSATYCIRLANHNPKLRKVRKYK